MRFVFKGLIRHRDNFTFNIFSDRVIKTVLDGEVNGGKRKIKSHSDVAEDSNLMGCDTLNSTTSRLGRIIYSNGVESFVCS